MNAVQGSDGITFDYISIVFVFQHVLPTARSVTVLHNVPPATMASL